MGRQAGGAAGARRADPAARPLAGDRGQPGPGRPLAGHLPRPGGPVHEAHTLGHVDVSVSETDGRITAFAVLTRDVTSVPEPLPGPADLPDRVASAVVNGPIDPTEY